MIHRNSSSPLQFNPIQMFLPTRDHHIIHMNQFTQFISHMSLHTIYFTHVTAYNLFHTSLHMIYFTRHCIWFISHMSLHTIYFTHVTAYDLFHTSLHMIYFTRHCIWFISHMTLHTIYSPRHCIQYLNLFVWLQSQQTSDLVCHGVNDSGSHKVLSVGIHALQDPQAEPNQL